MTRMSHFTHEIHVPCGPNTLKRLRFVAVACILLVPLSAMSACIFPPNLELIESDAGPGAAPVIESVSPPELAPPGPLSLTTDPLQPPMGLVIRDPDSQDASLHIRFFLDYSAANPSGSVTDCTIEPQGVAARAGSCPVHFICLEEDDGDYFLEAMVADRPFLVESDPNYDPSKPFRSLPETGAASFRAWELTCSSSLQ